MNLWGKAISKSALEDMDPFQQDLESKLIQKLTGKKAETKQEVFKNVPKPRVSNTSQHVPLFNNSIQCKPILKAGSQQTKRPPLRNITNTVLNTHTRVETSQGLREITKGIII